MSRPIRIQYPGALYHITARGNGGNDIFLGPKDYQLFLTVFFDVLERCNWLCYMYCLMPNHYHLFIETPDPNLSVGMRQLNGDYTQKFNIRHQRRGHIFQGRFKSVLVEKESYFYRVIRYIILNPVRAGLANGPLDWPWSGFREMMGRGKRGKCISVPTVLKHFDTASQSKARQILCDYVYQKIEDENPWKELKGGIILGSESFAEKIREFSESDRLEIEIPRRERYADRPDLRGIFNGCNIKNRYVRNIKIRLAYHEYGYSLSEIGRELGLHYSAISKIIKNR